MGRQESLIRVDCLAEVAGIEKAIRESEELRTLEYLDCVCAARARRDLYRGDWAGMRRLTDIKEGEQPIYKKGDLFAVVVGARLYQYADGFHWIDCLAGIEEPGYMYLMEDISLVEAREEAESNPEAAKKAERFMRRSLNKSYNWAMRGEDPIELPEEFALGEPNEIEDPCDIPF